MKKLFVAFVLVFLMQQLRAQESERTMISGKISSDTSELEGIYVISKQTEKVAISERGGYFSILAKEGDSLMFSAIQFKAKIIVLTKSDFEKELFFVKLETMIHQLDEVKIIRYDHINAVSLGIIPGPAKKYTPAERRLRTAGDLKPQDFIGLLGGGMQTDPIINALTGRTAMLKKEIKVEKKEFLIAMLEDMYDEDYIIDKLKIPAIYVKGFLFYLAENDKFATLVKSKNKSVATFLIGELAVKYNEIISCESE